jgi:hypothetical protein
VILVRRAAPFLALCLALFLVGCSLLPAPLNGAPLTQPGPAVALPADLAARRDTWLRLGPRDYTWVIQYGCECGLTGEFTITVVGGRATQIQWPPRFEPGVELPVTTVDDLYAMAASTIGEGGAVPASWGDGGVPTTITFDPVPNAIDDELSVTVVSFTPTD